MLFLLCSGILELFSLYPPTLYDRVLRLTFSFADGALFHVEIFPTTDSLSRFLRDFVTKFEQGDIRPYLSLVKSPLLCFLAAASAPSFAAMHEFFPPVPAHLMLYYTFFFSVTERSPPLPYFLTFAPPSSKPFPPAVRTV